MADHLIPYGQEKIPVRLPEGCKFDWIEPSYIPPASDPVDVIRRSLANPVDGKRIQDFHGAQSAVIAINDKTRPVPNEILLPPLLDELHRAGIAQQNIKFLIATGTHKPMQPDEFLRILPVDISSRYEVISHDCDDQGNLVFLGQTSRGTQVWANRLFVEADLRIMVGNIEPHHFAGFSGGHKTAAIGLTSRTTINHNHAMLMEPGAYIAHYDDNPLRQDIEEIGALVGGNFALNAILNGDKKVVQAVSGEPLAVMRAGIQVSRQICQIKVNGTYDMVIASAGGAPKDINFYQSQKALTHASLFTRDGGVILLAAACPEGTGSQAYEDFMAGLSSPAEVFAKSRAMGFRVGPHKAFQVARDAARVSIVLVSMIPADLVSRLLMHPAATLEEAVQTGFHLLSPTPPQDLRIAILPRATNTIPDIAVERPLIG